MKQPVILSLEFCPLCKSQDPTAWFTLQGYPVLRCRACGLAMLDPQPDDAVLASIYDDAYFIGSDDEGLHAQASTLKRETAKLQLEEILSLMPGGGVPAAGPRMLEVGCGSGDFLVEARHAGFDVRGIDVSASAVASANRALGEERARVCELEKADFGAETFDIVVLADVIEHVRAPATFLTHVQRIVKTGGIIFLATPSLDSLSARLMGRYWMEFKPEHLFYFSRRTLRHLLEGCGFENISISPGRKVLNLGYVVGHFEKYPAPLLTPLLRLLGKILPGWLLSARFRVVASGINALARKHDSSGRDQTKTA